MEYGPAPLLTEADPITSSEGSIDPLGLYAIADSLGVKLAPGVRERQSHPRFLTAMAVGDVICSPFPEDTVARDGVSEPWQVYEWYFVEGLVRTLTDSNQLQGLPGRDKARRAINDRVHLSQGRYLKTPSVFGFHGVYRILANELDIATAEGLGEVGYRLSATWEKEQGLKGFCFSENGSMHPHRYQIYSAVDDGLKSGAVDRAPGWNGWNFFKDHLSHKKCGKEESDVIFGALVAGSDFRKQVIEFLITPEGQNVWRNSESERIFHRGLIKITDPDLRALLDAILAYERFARLLLDAFQDCLMLMTQKRTKISPRELAKSDCVKMAVERLPALFPEVSDKLLVMNESTRFEEGFTRFSTKMNGEEWVETLLAHHVEIQRKKPPFGKNPWFEQIDDGSAIVRSGYYRDTGGARDESYVHGYRTFPLWSFMRDLGKVTDE
jgi:hypothetical protein